LSLLYLSVTVCKFGFEILDRGLEAINDRSYLTAVSVGKMSS